MQKASTITPILSVGKSQGSLNDMGVTYNQAGVSYNETGYVYGGFSGYSDVVPLISQLRMDTPIGLANRTQRYIEEQNITYNENGVIYNDPLFAYGGLYGQADIPPIISLAVSPRPSITNYTDIYTKGVIPGTRQISIGPGFFMYVTAVQ